MECFYVIVWQLVIGVVWTVMTNFAYNVCNLESVLLATCIEELNNISDEIGSTNKSYFLKVVFVTSILWSLLLLSAIVLL